MAHITFHLASPKGERSIVRAYRSYVTYRSYKPYGRAFWLPSLGEGLGVGFPYGSPPLGRGWGWGPDSYSLKNQDSSLLSHENVNLNQRNVLTGLPPKFSMNSRRRLCLYGNPTFKKKTCR